MEKLLLTAEESAELLSIGRSKVYELMAGGVLPSVKVGRCRRIPRKAIDDFVESLSAGAV
ncbi:MAG: transcriptional regulator [Pseudonocardiales bacterium]|nr:MAG: transcriptional regulator [Pseudonocardiales bacterium]